MLKLEYVDVGRCACCARTRAALRSVQFRSVNGIPGPSIGAHAAFEYAQTLFDDTSSIIPATVLLCNALAA